MTLHPSHGACGQNRCRTPEVRRTHASRLTRAVQWSVLTVWPAGGQRQARRNAWIGNVDDDGYAVPAPRRPGPPTQRERRTFSGKAP